MAMNVIVCSGRSEIAVIQNSVTGLNNIRFELK